MTTLEVVALNPRFVGKGTTYRCSVVAHPYFMVPEVGLY
jgi:hypothetical protein